jgi:hypothetical protein
MGAPSSHWCGIVVRIEGLLRAAAIDRLTEVAMLIEQPHADNRDTESTRGLELIARNNAEPTRIDRSASLSMNSMQN